MKRIIAILISLIFVIGVFGVASVAEPCDLPGVSTIRVGDTFFVYSPCPICDGADFLEDSNPGGGGGHHYYTAKKPGEVRFCYRCGPEQIGCKTVTILPPCNLPDEITVRVGDTFTLKDSCKPCDESYLDDKYLGDGVHQFKALKPGKVSFCYICGDPEYCSTVTILPRALPMDKFMKIFGFGKKNKE